MWENDVSNAWSAQPHAITAEFIASDYIRTWKKTYEYCRKNIWITEKKYGIQIYSNNSICFKTYRMIYHCLCMFQGREGVAFINFVANLVAIFLRGDLLVAALIGNDILRVRQP